MKYQNFFFQNFLNKILLYSSSELRFGALLGPGGGKVKNPEKIFLNQHEMFFVAPSMLAKGCFKLFHFGRTIFFCGLVKPN